MTTMDARLAALVGDFTPSLDEFEATALRHLAELFGFDAGFFATIGPNFVQRSPLYMHRVLADPERYDPGQRKAREIVARFGPAFIDTDAYTHAERDRLPIFRELLRPEGISSVLLATVNIGSRTTGMLHLVRSARPFDGEALVAARPLLRAIAIMHQAIIGLPTDESQAASQAAAQRVARLSAREHEVATLAADGYATPQIAARLGTSVHTVRRQLEATYRKCGTSSRAELATLMHDAERMVGVVGTADASAGANLVRLLGSWRMHPAVRLAA